MPLAAGIVRPSVVAFKSCFERRRLGANKSTTLTERIISSATATFVFVVNLSGAAALSELKSSFERRIISPTTATLLSCALTAVPRHARWTHLGPRPVKAQLHNVAVVGENVRPVAICSTSTNKKIFPLKFTENMICPRLQE